MSPAAGSDGEGLEGILHSVGSMCQELLEEYRDAAFDIDEIRRLMDEELGPFQTVFLTECVAMNKLTSEIVRTVHELEMGLKGEANMGESSEALMESIHLDKVPSAWQRVAYASNKPLGAWLLSLQARRSQLSDWADAPMEMPPVTWLGGLFNPQSFLTAVMQRTARRQGTELDALTTITEVTKKSAEETTVASRDGAFVVGLYLEGARWDAGTGFLADSRPKELFCELHVVLIKAVDKGKENLPQIAQVPVYKTQRRGPTYVFTAQLKSRHAAEKWIMAGVVLVLEVC
jgi:dynein heavy chain